VFATASTESLPGEPESIAAYSTVNLL